MYYDKPITQKEYIKLFKKDFENQLNNYKKYDGEIGDERVQKLFNKIMRIWTFDKFKNEIDCLGDIKSSFQTEIWSIFHHVVDTSSFLDFARGLRSFLVNVLLDDSSYCIKKDVVFAKDYFHKGSKAVYSKYLYYGNDYSGRTDIEGIEKLIDNMIKKETKRYKAFKKRYLQIQKLKNKND